MSGNLLEQLARDTLAARNGDALATARLVRRGLPWLVKRNLPQAAPLVDLAAGVYDAIARPEARPTPATEDGYATAGYRRFVSWISGVRDGVYVIVGATGTGKTTTMCAIADRWTNASHRYIVGVGRRALDGTPLEPLAWDAAKIARLPRDSVLLVPDSGLYLDSRDFGRDTEQAVRALATIARHRRVRIVLDVQYTSLLAKSAFLCRALLFKPLGVAWEVTERDELRKLARLSQDAFGAIPAAERRGYVYALADEADFKGLVPVTPPAWYSDAISTAHADDDDDDETIEGEYTEVGE